jgi:hypothetical protein
MDEKVLRLARMKSEPILKLLEKAFRVKGTPEKHGGFYRDII